MKTLSQFFVITAVMLIALPSMAEMPDRRPPQTNVEKVLPNVSVQKYTGPFLVEKASEILYPPVGDAHFRLPDGRTDVLVAWQRNAVGSVKTFFGQKNVDVKKVNYNPNTNWVESIVLSDGSLVPVTFAAPYGYYQGVNICQTDHDDVCIRYPGGRRIIERRLWGPTNYKFPYAGNFDSAPYALEMHAQDDSVIWSKVYFYRDISRCSCYCANVRGCGSHDPEEDIRDTLGSRGAYYLPDKSVAIVTRSSPDSFIIRIDIDTGEPLVTMDSIRAVNSKDYLAFRDAVFSRMESIDREDLLDQDYFFKIRELFLFPHLSFD